MAYLHHRCDGICLKGGIGRRSLEALMEKTMALMRNIDPPAIAVLAFQCLGVAHHPPEGVHTYSFNHSLIRLFVSLFVCLFMCTCTYVCMGGWICIYLFVGSFIHVSFYKSVFDMR